MDLRAALQLAADAFAAREFDRAARVCAEILRQAPGETNALNILALVALQNRQFDRAAEILRRALATEPDSAALHLNLGKALAAANRWDQAAAAFAKAGDPSHLAMALARLDRWSECADAARAALVRRNNDLMATSYLALALRKLGDFAESARLSHSLPHDNTALDNLGHIALESGQFPAAIDYFQRAAAVRNSADAQNNLGSAFFKSGDYSRAAFCYDSALQLSPNHPTANTSRGQLYLLHGDFARGWPMYQYRWLMNFFRGYTHPPMPEWNGADLAGRRILIHCEQGYGDAIQFARYLLNVTEKNGRIILAARKELHRLFKSIGAPIIEWVGLGEPLPHYDAHAPLMSLPRILGTTQQNIPSPIPYIHPERGPWHDRLGGDPRRKIGLIWSGSQFPDPKRSIPVEALAPLVKLANLHFISLQKNYTGPPPPLPITDWTAELTDFADTAALMSQLDLILTIDSAPAHLAGALGKPVWVLLPFVPDWRWLLDRNDSPWYPTMRLFRQPRMDDWQTPIGQAAWELETQH